jgi:hypothetical protein
VLLAACSADTHGITISDAGQVWQDGGGNHDSAVQKTDGAEPSSTVDSSVGPKSDSSILSQDGATGMSPDGGSSDAGFAAFQVCSPCSGGDLKGICALAPNDPLCLSPCGNDPHLRCYAGRCQQYKGGARTLSEVNACKDMGGIVQYLRGSQLDPSVCEVPCQ